MNGCGFLIGGSAPEFGTPILLAGTYSGGIQVWNLTNFKLEFEGEAHQGRVHGMSMSRDGKLMVTSSHDGTALIWDLSKLLGGGKGEAEKTAMSETVNGTTRGDSPQLH